MIAPLLFALALSQSPSASQYPAGIVRGELVSVQQASLLLRLADGREQTCAFGPKSWFERDSQRIEPAALRPGDRLEMVADRQGGGCFARSIHILENPPLKQVPGRRPSLKREYPSPTESFAPRGDFTLSGIVTELGEERLTIRTRAQGNHTFLIRHDTRFLSEGLRQTRADLGTGKRVFIRGGTNLEGQVEAYSVAWGEILKP